MRPLARDSDGTLTEVVALKDEATKVSMPPVISPYLSARFDSSGHLPAFFLRSGITFSPVKLANFFLSSSSSASKDTSLPRAAS